MQSREAGTSGTWRDADRRLFVETEMPLVDCRKLCPKSGHVLSNDARDALRAERAAGTDVIALVEAESTAAFVSVPCAADDLLTTGTTTLSAWSVQGIDVTHIQLG